MSPGNYHMVTDRSRVKLAGAKVQTYYSLLINTVVFLKNCFIAPFQTIIREVDDMV